jgi:ribonuclease Z
LRFIFKEKSGEQKIIKSQIDKYNVPIKTIKSIQQGEDFINAKGETIANSLLTSPPPPTRSYAYVSDSCYLESIIPFISNANCLYHESTFKNEDVQRAADTFHSTASQAATIAQLANVNKLLLGHFSAKYKTEQLNELLNQAKEIFAESYLSQEGLTFNIE